MNVLVVNAGSSTLKYQVIDTKSHKVSAKGSCERVCFTGGTFTHAANGSKKVTENIEFPDHKVAIEVVLKDLEANGVKIEGIGHRIVQGGWYFGDSSSSTRTFSPRSVRSPRWPAAQQPRGQRYRVLPRTVSRPAQRHGLRHRFPLQHARGRQDLRPAQGRLRQAAHS